MSGKMCTGQKANNSFNPDTSRSYCEGRDASFNGALISTNPHESGSEDADAWDRGHDSYIVGGLTPQAPDCCARAGLLA